jgi:hypothetical protein
MKTRQEMIYDFMLVLAPNIFEEMRIAGEFAQEQCVPPIDYDVLIKEMYEIAGGFADQYLKGIN